MCNEDKIKDNFYVCKINTPKCLTYNFYNPQCIKNPYIGRLTIGEVYDGEYRAGGEIVIEEEFKDQGYEDMILEYATNEIYKDYPSYPNCTKACIRYNNTFRIIVIGGDNDDS